MREGEGSHPSYLTLTSLPDFWGKEDLVGEVDLGADHLLSEAGEGLCRGSLAKLDGEGGQDSWSQRCSIILVLST